MSRNKYIAFFFILIVVFASFCLHFFYLKKVTIYEPLTIKTFESARLQKKGVQFYSISPLGRKLVIPYIDSLGAWYYYYSFHQAIGVVIPDSLKYQMKELEIQVGERKTIVLANSLRCRDSSANSKNFNIVVEPTGHSSYINIILSVRHWNAAQRFTKIVLLALSFFLIIIFYKKVMHLLVCLAELTKKILAISWLRLKLAKSACYLACKNLILRIRLQESLYRRRFNKCLLLLFSKLMNALHRIGSVFFQFYKLAKCFAGRASIFTRLFVVILLLSTILEWVLFKNGIIYAFTGYYIIISFFSVLFFFTKLVLWIIKKRSYQLRQNISLLFFIIMLSFLLMELVLRLSGIKATYSKTIYSYLQRVRRIALVSIWYWY